MAKIHNNAVARDAKNEYKTCVTSAEEETESFLTDVEIQTKHLDAQKKALNYFDRHQMGDDESNSENLNDLDKV